MKINSLQIVNFRPFGSLSLDFSDGLNLIVGNNGVGKTSILEAIYLLSSSRSFRTNDYREVIKHDHEYTAIDGKILIESIPGNVEENKLRVYLTRKGKEYRLNMSNIPQAEFYGYFGCVSQSNRDMFILRGAPEDRRKFLDRAISISRPFYLGSYLGFRKILQQRNALLKKFKGSPQHSAGRTRKEISSWNLLFAKTACTIITEREKYLRELNESVVEKYRRLFDRDDTIEIEYKPSIKKKTKDLANDIMEEMERNSDQDFQRGYTTAGPHRDDFKFYLNGKDVSSFGSSGQQRSVVFALKMSEAHLFEKERDEKPVLLLDDIDTELDVERMRKAIGMKDEKMQLIVTTTKPELLEKLEKPVKVVKISDGSIREITNGIG